MFPPLPSNSVWKHILPFSLLSPAHFIDSLSFFETFLFYFFILSGTDLSPLQRCLDDAECYGMFQMITPRLLCFSLDELQLLRSQPMRVKHPNGASSRQSMYVEHSINEHSSNEHFSMSQKHWFHANIIFTATVCKFSSFPKCIFWKVTFKLYLFKSVIIIVYLLIIFQNCIS